MAAPAPERVGISGAEGGETSLVGVAVRVPLACCSASTSA